MDVKRGSEMKLRNLLFVVFVFIVFCGAVWRLSFEKSGLIYYPASGAELVSLSAKVDASGYPATAKLINMGSGVSYPYYITSGVAFSDLITLEFENGAMLVIPNDTVYINGQFKAEPNQFVIDCSSGGTVIWGSGSIEKMHGAWYNAYSDDGEDDTDAMHAFLRSCAGEVRDIQLAEGVYDVTDTLQIAHRDITIYGVGQQNLQTRINLSGATTLFQMDYDDGNPWDESSYDGIQGFNLYDLLLNVSGSTIELENQKSYYIPDTYAIRDWRGGDVVLVNVRALHFEYGFWGIQSDQNVFTNTIFTYNKYAYFLGPRCDQNTFYELRTFGNDTVVHFDGAQGVQVHDWTTVHDGSNTTYPILVEASTSRATKQIVITEPWIEAFGSAVTKHALSKIEVGTGVLAENIIFENPLIQQSSAAPARLDHFSVVGNCASVIVNQPQGSITQFGRSFWAHDGSSTGYAFATGSRDAIEEVTLLGSGYLNLTTYLEGTGNPLDFASITGRIQATVLPTNSATTSVVNEKSYIIEPITNGCLNITRPDTADSNTSLIKISNRFIWANVNPGTLSETWDVGDRAVNTAPSELGTAGNKYIVDGWICTVSGTPGTWLEQRTLTGN